MRVGYAYFARYLESNPDGTFGCMGGGFTSVRTAQYPFVFPISLFIKFVECDPQDASPLHVRLDIIKSDGGVLLHTPMSSVVPKTPKQFGQSGPASDVASLAVNLGPVVFQTPGEYEFRFTIGEGDSQFVTSLTLHAEEVTNAT